jgi:hemerythrin-like domain-containing protein
MTEAKARRAARVRLMDPVELHEFDALDRTHAEVVGSLRQLERLVNHVDTHGSDESARDTASKIRAFFDGTARAHHEEEERLVFPPLRSGGDADLIQQVQRLQQDHGWLEEDWRELRPQLSALAEGYTGFDTAALRQMATVFSTLYLEHIVLEESLIYPAAKARLASAAQGGASRKSPRPR